MPTLLKTPIQKIEEALLLDQRFEAQRILDQWLKDSSTSDTKECKTIACGKSEHNGLSCYPENIFKLISEQTNWLAITINWKNLNRHKVALNQAGDRSVSQDSRPISAFHLILGKYVIIPGYMYNKPRNYEYPQIVRLQGSAIQKAPEIPASEFWRVEYNENFTTHASPGLKLLKKSGKMQTGIDYRKIAQRAIYYIDIENPSSAAPAYTIQFNQIDEWYRAQYGQISNSGYCPQDTVEQGAPSIQKTKLSKTWDKSQNIFDKLTALEESKNKELKTLQNKYNKESDKDSVFEKYKKETDIIRSKFENKTTKIKKLLIDEVKIACKSKDFGEEWTIIKSNSGLDFHTQGYGANKYAEDSAQQKALITDAVGIQTEIISIPHGTLHNQTNLQYDVWAKMNPELNKFLPFFPYPELKTILINILKNGNNPMVYFPHLSWESIKSDFNLDHFGNPITC
jgi:hypothetical protein